jgi:hypothetical protein
MLRHSRLVMTILVAMFVVAVPTAMAESPVADQYQSAAPGGGTAATANDGSAAADVSDVSSSATDSLPFTGGQVALVALIGLGLLALGAAGLAITRTRGPGSTA